MPFDILSELLILLQLNLVWWHIVVRWIVLWNGWIALLWSRSESQKRFRIPVNVHVDISAQLLTFCNQTWYGDATSWARVSLQEDWFAVFKFRVTMRAHLIRYDYFYHICWTADLFTKFNWMVHHHKLECFV